MVTKKQYDAAVKTETPSHLFALTFFFRSNFINISATELKQALGEAPNLEPYPLRRGIHPKIMFKVQELAIVSRCFFHGTPIRMVKGTVEEGKIMYAEWSCGCVSKTPPEELKP